MSNDTIKVVATNVNNFVHATDTAIGTATGTAGTGVVGDFAATVGLISLNDTDDGVSNAAVKYTGTGDLAINFATPTGTFNKANFEARLQYDLTGTIGADTITGGALADTITGGAGRDSMTGGTGADTFVFATRAQAGNSYTGTDTDAAKIDRISDFTVTDDKIQLATTANSFGTSLQFTTSTVMNVAAAVTVPDADYADLAAVMTALQTASAGVASNATTAQAIVVTVATKAAADTAGDFDTVAPGKYLVINDDTAAWAATDTIINITGLTGTVAAGNFTFV